MSEINFKVQTNNADLIHFISRFKQKENLDANQTLNNLQVRSTFKLQISTLRFYCGKFKGNKMACKLFLKILWKIDAPGSKAHKKTLDLARTEKSPNTTKTNFTKTRKKRKDTHRLHSRRA